MIQFFPGEEWIEIKTDHTFKFRYAVSNLGRMMSFTDRFEDGRILKGSSVEEYKIFRYKISRDGKIRNGHLFFHKLIAEAFLPKDSDELLYVIHLDYNRKNNHIDNLKWASAREMVEHSKKSPFVIEARKKRLEKMKGSDGHKLTIAQVKIIKKKLSDPNRKTRMKMIARQFGISEMQLYRIKSGENWGHILLDEKKPSSAAN